MSHEQNTEAVSLAAAAADGDEVFLPGVPPQSHPPISTAAAPFPAAEAARSSSEFAALATTCAPFNQLSTAVASSFHTAGDDGSSVRSVWSAPTAPAPQARASEVRSRSREADIRLGVHELSHCMIGLLSGRKNPFVSIEPASTFGGLCWWDDPAVHETFDLNASDREALNLADKVRALMPGPGQSRDCASQLVADAMEDIVMSMAGEAGEYLFVGQPQNAGAYSSDRIKARAAARKICASAASTEALITWGLAEATARLSSYRCVVLHAAEALIVARTLGPDAIYRLLAEGMSMQALADAKERRTAWSGIVENAAAMTSQFQRVR